VEAAENGLFPLLRASMAGRLGALGGRYADVHRNVREDAALAGVLAFTLGRDSCCVDVGSHGGRVLQEMLRCAPEGRHIAFEPIPALARDLARRFPTVDVRESALADVDGSTTFEHVVSEPAYSSLHARAGTARGWPDHIGPEDVQTIDVRMERLDSALPDGWAPDLLKIDVEGAEARVLAGAAETIARHRPVVVFEHMGSDNGSDSDSEEVWALVAGFGLRIYDMAGSGPYGRERFLASAAQLANTNYVCRR
jgi:FkbM family methyltransferase